MPTAALSGYSFSYASEPDNGMYDAINKGIEQRLNTVTSDPLKVAGEEILDNSSQITDNRDDEIVAWLNCDEQYLPGSLQKVASWFQAHPDKDILFGSVVVVDKANRYVCSRKPVIPFKWHVATDHLPVLSAALFVRRSVLCEERWFDPLWKNRGDSEWILRMLDRNVSMGTSVEYFSAFCDRDGSLGMTEDSLAEQEKLAAGVPSAIWRMRPLWVIINRIRKLISGGYFQRPFQYAVYCGSDDVRNVFSVSRPKTRWERVSRKTRNVDCRSG